MAAAALSAARPVPRRLMAVLAAALVLQLAAGMVRPPDRRAAKAIPAPPPLPLLRGFAMGDPQALSAALVLSLQAYDDQPGASVPFAELDYHRLVAWLERALALDPRSDYPLLLAAQVYSQVPDAARQRLMLDFVHRAFLADPDRRWRWLAHAALIARHRLHDDRLGLRYARDIAERARAAPSWARQMHIFLLEDVGEREQAKILLGGLLASGTVPDPAEIRFITQRLAGLGGRRPGRDRRGL